MSKKPEPEEVMQFPMRFPVKVMGRNEDGFRAVVEEILVRHVGDSGSLEVSTRESRDGNFLAVTVVFEAESRNQLDALYRELSDHERVLMAL